MASGSTLLTFAAAAYEPVSSGATPDTRNGHLVLDYDDTTDESAIFSSVMPRNYSGGGITVYVHYAMTSATTGKVRWDVALERVGDSQQDIDSDGFATAQSINVAAVPGTSGYVDIVSAAFTDGAQMDSIAVGEGFRLKVTRVPSDTSNDTATGDAELRWVEIKET